VKVILCAFAAALALAGCSSSGSPSATTVTATSKVTVTESSAQASGPIQQYPESSGAPAAPAADSWPMPNEIGKDLQTAQDDLQALTGNPMFISTSKDLTGEARHQINDRNWQVCSSTPPPGGTFTSQTNVVFGVVRNSEMCP